MQEKEELNEAGDSGRRFAAFVIDLLIVGIIYYSIAIALGWRSLFTFNPVFPYPLRFGFLLFLYSFISDVILAATPGKIIMSLRLSYPDHGGLSWVLFREILKINPYALLLDVIFGLVLTPTSLRITDDIFKGIVVRIYPELVQVESQRPIYTRPPPPPPPKSERKPMEPSSHAIEGRCPRCGMPFAIGRDGREISGLWNGYCIWCGYPVRERVLGE